MLAFREHNNAHVRSIDLDKEDCAVDCSEKEAESHKKGLSIEQAGVVQALELPSRLQSMVKAKNGDTIQHADLPQPPPLPSSGNYAASTSKPKKSKAAAASTTAASTGLISHSAILPRSWA